MTKLLGNTPLLSVSLLRVLLTQHLVFADPPVIGDFPTLLVWDCSNLYTHTRYAHTRSVHVANKVP